MTSVNAVKKTNQTSVKIATKQFATRRNLQNTQHDNINAPKYEIMIENAMQMQQRSVEQSAEQSLEQSLAQHRRDELLIDGMNSCADHHSKEDNQVSNQNSKAHDNRHII